ncbi:unnamed protein product, partial [Cylicocyclus nassatus]
VRITWNRVAVSETKLQFEFLMLAKLVCARHKPRQQTVIPFEFVPVLFEETRIGDNRMLGGKLGNSILCNKSWV